MEIRKIEDQKIWNDFLIDNNGSFLQFWDWGEFQKKFSKKIHRIVVKKKEKILLLAQIIQSNLLIKSYLYIPYGPVFDKNISSEFRLQAFNLFLKEIKSIARKEKSIFLRIEPTSSLPEVHDEFVFLDSFKRVQPQKTLFLDLRKSEDELLKDLHNRTRYNIRLSKRKGIKLKIVDEYLPEFYLLTKQTKKRQGFSSYSEEYYKELLNINSNNIKTKLFLAEYENKIIVASIIIFFGDKATFLHTGSNYEYRSTKASHFLRWETVLYAKEKGYNYFDFWGISEKKWPGVTYFKKGFGGIELEYVKGKDIVFENFWYNIYKLAKKIL